MSMLAAILQQTVRFTVTPAAPLAVNDLYLPLSLAPAAFWSVVRPDGADIRVTTQDGVTQCAREVVAFDYANRVGGLYFAANGGSAYYLCAGSGQSEPLAASSIGKNSVWEASAHGVWHMADLTDSTANGLNSDSTSAVVVDAKIGKGYQFTQYTNTSPLNSVLRIGSQASLDFSSAFTVAGWYKHLATAADGAIFSKIYTGSHNGYMLWKSAGQNTIRLYVNGATRLTTPTLTVGEWYFIAARWDGSYLYLRCNNTDVTRVAYGTAPNSVGYSALIGGYRESDSVGHTFGSIVDEVRAYNRFLSDDELAQMCANQNDPAAFWTIGAAG